MRGAGKRPMNEQRPKWLEGYPELLVELGQVIAEQIAAHGVATDRAQDCARRIVEHILDAWGNQQVYVPSGRYVRSIRRASSIRERYTGDNVAALAREHGITPRRVRQILGDCEAT